MRYMVLIFALMASACATAPKNATSFTDTQIGVPDEANSVVVVYRKMVPPVLYSVNVSLDGARVATLPNRSFTWFYVKPGPHELKISWPALAMIPGSKVGLTAEAGKVHYVEFSGGLEVAGGITPTAFTTSNVGEKSENAAEAELRQCCKYVPAQL